MAAFWGALLAQASRGEGAGERDPRAEKPISNDARVAYWNSIRTGSADEPRTAVLKAQLRKGIPPSQRARLHFWLSGGAAMQAAAPAGTFTLLTKTSRLPRELVYAINEDAAGRQGVRRLLIALYQSLASKQDSSGGAACAAPGTGADAAAVIDASAQVTAPAVKGAGSVLPAGPQAYCRGLAALAAFILAIQGPGREEEAFWTLAALLQRRLFPYACSAAACPAGLSAYALGFRVEARVLDALAAKKLPAVGAHLARLELSVAALLGPWLPSMFAGVLPPEVVARLLDCAMLEGSKVLLRAGLALLKMHSTTILGSHNPQQLRKVLEARFSRLVDPEQLVAVAFKGVGSMGHERIALTRAGALRAEEARAQEVAAQLAQVIAPSKRKLGSL